MRTIPDKLIILTAVGALTAFLAWTYYAAPAHEIERAEELTEYMRPEHKQDDVLIDDRLEDKKPAFDAAIVDRRPLGPAGAWLLNASEAVIRLDVPIVKPDVEERLLVLHPSYASAMRNMPSARAILPSVNLLDGKAKQFDDGLYAAIDLAHYQGVKGKLESHAQLIKRMADKAGKSSIAAPFLAAGLELAGVKIEIDDVAAKERLLVAFQNDEVASKPIGFYGWNAQLSELFRFMRYFQRQFGGTDARALAIPQALAAILSGDGNLLADYRRVLAFYARLSNPAHCLSLVDISGVKSLDMNAVSRLTRKKQVANSTVAVFPPGTAKETVLFEKLFPTGVPPNADLMKELVRRVRAGEVDLRPNAGSGWYDYQAHALETLLLPEKGAEKDKLLLTREYKARMLEAFKALMTKRRETHVRNLSLAEKGIKREPPPLEVTVSPRLRVEPAPTYYLRTARAYAFLANVLEAAIGKQALRGLHGLKQDGKRTNNLHTELLWMRDAFYGLYLISAEDIGMKASFAAGEPVDEDHCYRIASAWLAKVIDDADLAADTRVAVPVYVDPLRGVTRLWITLGVRLAKLDAGYVRPPRIKPAQGDGDWALVTPGKLKGADYLIAVDEFAEVELNGLRTLSREELRAICDREKTKEAIVAALRKQ